MGGRSWCSRFNRTKKNPHVNEIMACESTCESTCKWSSCMREFFYFVHGSELDYGIMAWENELGVLDLTEQLKVLGKDLKVETGTAELDSTEPAGYDIIDY